LDRKHESNGTGICLSSFVSFITEFSGENFLCRLNCLGASLKRFDWFVELVIVQFVHFVLREAFTIMIVMQEN